MSPTSIVNMKTTSSPHGRTVKKDGNPIDITKILGGLDIAYMARGALDTPADIMKTGKMIKKALQKQMNGEGFCLVEVLSLSYELAYDTCCRYGLHQIETERNVSDG